MPVTQSVAFEILASVEKYRAGLAQMPGITAEAAAKAALKLEKELVRAQVTAAKAAQDAATKGAKAHEDAAQRSGRAYEDASRGLEKGMKALGGPFASTADLVFDLGESLSLLASPVGLVVGGVTAAAFAFGALVTAGVAGVATLGAATLAADEALEALAGFELIDSDFYPAVPSETLASIEAVNASMDAFTSIGERVAVVAGGNVAASFEKVADVAVGLSLTAAETFEEFAKGRDLLHEFAVFMGGALLNSLLAPLVPLGGLAAGFLALSQAAGVDLPDGAEAALDSFARLSTNLPALSHDLAETVVGFGENTVAASGLGAALEGVSAKGAAFISTQQRATAALEAQKTATSAARKEAAELAKEQEKAAKEAAHWAHELSLVRDGADLTELAERLDEVTAAQTAGAISAAEASELQIAAFGRYEDAVVAAEEKVRTEQERTAKEEEARLKDLEQKRRDSLTDFQRDIEDTAEKLSNSGWDTAAADVIAKIDTAWGSAADAAEPYLDTISALASASLDTHTSALEEIQGQIDDIAGLTEGLASTTVDASTLSGDALVDAYKSGAVAAEDLTDVQKAQIEAQLKAETAALEEQATIERQAAMGAFNTQKAADIAGTLTAGLRGGVAAFQLGPVAGALAAAGIAALTATNVALIAKTKPAFHAGGLYPDEGNATLLGGEGVLNRQAVQQAGGAQAVAAMNAGAGASSSSTMIRIGRLQAREIVRTDLRGGGLIASTINSTAGPSNLQIRSSKK